MILNKVLEKYNWLFTQDALDNDVVAFDNNKYCVRLKMLNLSEEQKKLFSDKLNFNENLLELNLDIKFMHGIEIFDEPYFCLYAFKNQKEGEIVYTYFTKLYNTRFRKQALEQDFIDVEEK